MLDFLVLLLVMISQYFNIFRQLIASSPQLSVFVIQLSINSHQMLNFHFVLFQSVQCFIFHIRPVNVNGLFDWNFDWNFPINVHWNLAVNVNRLVNIYDLLCNCGNFHCLNYLFINFVWHFLFNFNILRYFNDFLNDSLRAWNCLEYLHNNLDRFLYNHFLYDLFWYNTFVSVNLCIPVFQKFSQHIQFNFQLVFFALKSVQPLFKINRFFLNVLIVLQLELKPDSFSLGLLKVLLKFMNFLEKLFQTIFVFIILFNLDFNLLVTSLAFWLICIQLLFNLVTGDFSIFCWNQNRDKWFHIFPYSLCLNFRISEPFS